jgi:hypothetical protein
MFSPYTVDEAVVLRKAIIPQYNAPVGSHLLSLAVMAGIASQETGCIHQAIPSPVFQRSILCDKASFHNNGCGISR